MRCPVCETENSAGAAECARCGKQLAAPAYLVEDVRPIEGLEETIHDPRESATGPVQLLPEVEFTQVASKDLPVRAEAVPGVEHTQIEMDPSVAPLWTGGVDLDLGREPDDGARTPAPQDAKVCPFCGTSGEGAVCDNCGRRKTRYLEPAADPGARAAASSEKVLCPSCLARVLPGPRCSDCGLPFPMTEI
jgi:hypothetical protein